MIVKAEKKDTAIAAALASELWPNHIAGELELEFADLLGQREAAVFLKLEENIPVVCAKMM